ncbi:MAG TPA: serine hydrolase domain-containing protein [Solirubrobacteraceae bacterium]|nr:serine hydrolase domain-containing protein [Solirubrobacteraceae bacterium]
MSFDGADIERLLEGGVEQGTWHGVVAVVVDRDGVLYEGAAGQADTRTMFRNASMTKAVATTGALQLVEQGLLELDATVESVLPEFGELQLIEGYGSDGPVLRAPASKPTFRQLMTHTAGLGYFFTNERLYEYSTAADLPSPLEGKRVSLDAPLVNDPGTMWEYGVNTDWLGLAIERITGMSLGEYLAENVYGPLGMVDSTFAPTAEQRARLLPLLMRTSDGGLAPTDIDLPEVSEWDAAGHGSYGTAGDYARFIRAWLRDGELDGERILGAETVALAFTDQIEGIALPEMMKSCMPELSNDVPSLPVPQGWGLGFHLVKVDLPGMRSAGTGGWSGLFNTYYWIDRAAGIGGVIMTQVLPFFDAKIVEAVFGFEIAAYAQIGAAVPAPAA